MFCECTCIKDKEETMIVTKQDLQEYLQADYVAQYGNEKSTFLRSMNPVYRMKRLLRIYEYRLNNAHKSVFHRVAALIAKIRYKRVSRTLCSEISPNVFGKGLQIWHGTRIIVNGHAKVGKNCSISSGVVIGQAHDQCPTIGNHVQLNINATVIGGIDIADGTVVGANALVVKDIPQPYTVWGGAG